MSVLVPQNSRLFQDTDRVLNTRNNSEKRKWSLFTSIFCKILIFSGKIRRMSYHWTKIVLPLAARTNTTFFSMKKKAISSNIDETPVKNYWRHGLLESINNPEEKIKEDDSVIVIKDKYPKSRHHYLVLPKININSIKELTGEHQDLLQHMEKIGQEVADEHKDYEFLLGYHAVPSMSRLHLHVISTDFDSPCLKTKNHWNSFTTEYFRPSHVVRQELKELGRARQVSEVHLKTNLLCHKCTFRPKNMPDLKKHLLMHINVK